MAPLNLCLILLTAEEDPVSPVEVSASSGSCSDHDGEWCNASEEEVRHQSTLCHCARAYLEAIRCPRTAFGTGYCAVLASSRVKQALRERQRGALQRWVPVETEGHDFLEEIANALERREKERKGGGGVDEGREKEVGQTSVVADVEEGLAQLASQIHHLMDCAPVTTDDYVVMDVHWVIAGTSLCSPSSSVLFFNALLRLRTWHEACIHIIVPDAYQEVWCKPLQEWEEAVDVARVWPASRWKPSGRSVLWRGSIHVQGLKQPTQTSVTVPGYTLQLSSDVALSPSLLEGVGLEPRYCPSHLELMQVVELATLPLEWLSPLQCNLSLSCPTTFSVDLFRVLSSSHAESACYLFCLCQSNTNPDLDASIRDHSKSTSDWVEYMQTRDDHPEGDDELHPLACYETGPVLLVVPNQSDDGPMSCDAWFLWKPSVVSMPPCWMDGEEPCTEGSEPIPSPSHWKAITALKTSEGIQRKMIKRVATADLMFGNLPAPPPSLGQTETLGVSEMLECFTDDGFPADATSLSPIAVTTPSKPTRMHNAADTLTYHSLVDSTPSTKKKRYHGVDYCFSNQDCSLDQKLTQIQQSYLISERASTCSNAGTPQAERARKEESRRKKRALRQAKEESNKEQAAKNGKGKEGKEHLEGVEVQEEATREGQQRVKKRTLKLAKEEVNKEPTATTGKGKEGEKGLRKIEAGTRVEAKETVKTGQQKVKKRTLKQAKEEAVKVHEKGGEKGPKMEVEAREEGGMTSQQKTGLEHQEPTSEGTQESESARNGKANRRKLLGDAVVSALKRNGMPRSHPHFRKSFERLFKVSKIFMEDMNPTKKHIDHVVNLNVHAFIP